jgi:MATE family multidrug resistance protein
MVSWVIATIYIMLLGIVFYLRFLGGKWKSMRVIETTIQVPKSEPLKMRGAVKL